jgi:hypothetical protein
MGQALTVPRAKEALGVECLLVCIFPSAATTASEQLCVPMPQLARQTIYMHVPVRMHVWKYIAGQQDP